ncbi:MAG TPA: hypothetical protein VHH15_09715 [Actinophytocola sp.]|nr:hypothetical protein [Actinophytocola sp.]
MEAVPELRPATLAPWNLDALTVDVSGGVVELRVVALALPLPPLLRRAETALRAALLGTELEHARVRLVVTDLDARALEDGETHPFGA